MLEIVIFIYIWLFSIGVIALGKRLGKCKSYSCPNVCKDKKIDVEIPQREGIITGDVSYDQTDNYYYTVIFKDHKDRVESIFIKADSVEELLEKIKSI